MQEGAFALIDCLGFKGIWKRFKPDLVLPKLFKIEEIVQAKLSEFNEFFVRFASGFKVEMKLMKPQVVLLSDTVAISVPQMYQGQNDNEYRKNYFKGMTIFHACILSSAILQYFIEEPPYLSMRGYITFGEHSMEKNFIVGPAVDEAASNYEIADGAFVWLHPEATKLYKLFLHGSNNFFASGKSPDANLSVTSLEIIGKISNMLAVAASVPIVIDDYNMPIKNGYNLECSVVNPLATFKDSQERAAIIENYLQSFNSDGVAVLLKKQNTMKLLKIADKKCEEFDLSNPDFSVMKEKFKSEFS